MAVKEKLFNNRLKLQVGYIVILDADKPNWLKVKIKALSDNHMFSTVEDLSCSIEEDWDVMTSRLSKSKF